MILALVDSRQLVSIRYNHQAYSACRREMKFRYQLNLFVRASRTLHCLSIKQIVALRPLTSVDTLLVNRHLP